MGRTKTFIDRRSIIFIAFVALLITIAGSILFSRGMKESSQQQVTSVAVVKSDDVTDLPREKVPEHEAPPVSEENPCKDEGLGYSLLKESRSVCMEGSWIKGADFGSFKPLGRERAVDEKNVYYREAILEGADPKTFFVYPEFYQQYAKDSQRVFLRDRIIEGADSKSFKPIDEGWSTDEDQVFYGGEVVESADPKSFQVVDSWGKDAKHIFWGKKIFPFGDNASFRLIDARENAIFWKDKNGAFCTAGDFGKNTQLSFVDAKTFSKMEDSYFLSFDVHFAYLTGMSNCSTLKPLEKNFARFVYEDEPVPGVERLGYRISRYKDKVYLNDNGPHALGWNQELDVDGKTFRILDSTYSKDKNGVYSNVNYNKVVLESFSEKVDPKNFRALGGGYGTDGARVYYAENFLEEADPKTFKSLNVFAKDKKSVWAGKCRVSSADPEAFVDLGFGYGKDDLRVYFYYGCQEVLGADSKSFRIADNGFNESPADFNRGYIAADKLHVYYDGIAINYPFDAASFLMITDSLGKDKNGVYSLTYEVWDAPEEGRNIERIEGADSKTIVGLSPAFAKDKNAIYCYGKRLANVDLQSFRVNWSPANPKLNEWRRTVGTAEDKLRNFTPYCEVEKK